MMCTCAAGNRDLTCEAEALVRGEDRHRGVLKPVPSAASLRRRLVQEAGRMPLSGSSNGNRWRGLSGRVIELRVHGGAVR